MVILGTAILRSLSVPTQYVVSTTQQQGREALNFGVYTYSFDAALISQNAQTKAFVSIKLGWRGGGSGAAIVCHFKEEPNFGSLPKHGSSSSSRSCLQNTVSLARPKERYPPAIFGRILRNEIHAIEVCMPIISLQHQARDPSQEKQFYYVVFPLIGRYLKALHYLGNPPNEKKAHHH